MTIENKKGFWLTSVFAVLVLVGISAYIAGQSALEQDGAAASQPKETGGGIVLPVRWSSLGKKLAEAGVLDATKVEELYAQRGGLTEAEKNMISGDYDGEIILTRNNSSLWLNLLWALGLGNKNAVLSAGPMTDPKYGGAGVFASTGGWPLARGSTMSHYGAHNFIALTIEQQALVEKVSKNVYRPCCDNPTYFPDCNHGMAMLGLLELAAFQGAGENELYAIALSANSMWFPDQYETIKQYFEKRGEEWGKIDPRVILSKDFSSSSGYSRVLAEVAPLPSSSGSSCGA